MAKPRVFVSSTYYDLKYIRASLEIFIESLGFEPILSEKGDIAYTSDRALDESCYREVENSEVFILIVGGRYGSEVSGGSRRPKDFFDRYESITKKEYGSAVERDIPIYVLVERAVYAEYQTFIRNKDLTAVKYAHVDSVNVFMLIEDILARPRNNPIHTFEKFEDIQAWLREQWSGLFRELLRRQSQQQQLAGLSQQVLQLKETNETLKKYLEAMMRGVNKHESSELIRSEERRLSKIEQLSANAWVRFLLRRSEDIDINAISDTIREASSFEDFVNKFALAINDQDVPNRLLATLRRNMIARRDFNKAREVLGLQPFDTPPEWKAPEEDAIANGEGSSEPSGAVLDGGIKDQPEQK